MRNLLHTSHFLHCPNCGTSRHVSPLYFTRLLQSPNIFTMQSLLVVGLLGVTWAPASAVENSGWDRLRQALDAWNAISFDADFAINVGNASGTQFLYETPGFSFENARLQGASLSKWPSAVMISGLVDAGLLSYDDKANKYLKWWPNTADDVRSGVTLRQLLSFTSGLQRDAEVECFFGDYDKCAQKMFEHTKKWQPPGTTWTYLSGHLQFAGAMALAAAGKTDMQELFSTYLYSKYNMTQTTYGPEKNPSMAGGITTTGQDFERLLHSLLTYTGLPKTIQDQMETDLSKAPVSPSGDGWFGHYGMGHWWECLGYGTPNERAPLPPICTDAHIQAGPGEFGYYPLLDRSGGGGAAGPTRSPYYFQVVLQEPDALSGIPEYLRLLVKPLTDILMTGGDPADVDRATILRRGGGLLSRDVSYIQSELLNCTCTGSSGAGQPYAALTRGQPADRAHMNRDALLANGEGLTLLDIEAVVKSTLGSCTCDGRRSMK